MGIGNCLSSGRLKKKKTCVVNAKQTKRPGNEILTRFLQSTLQGLYSISF